MHFDCFLEGPPPLTHTFPSPLSILILVLRVCDLNQRSSFGLIIIRLLNRTSAAAADDDDDDEDDAVFLISPKCDAGNEFAPISGEILITLRVRPPGGSSSRVLDAGSLLCARGQRPQLQTRQRRCERSIGWDTTGYTEAG